MLTGDSFSQAIASFDPPWADRPQLWRQSLSRILSYDSIVLAILRPDRPSADSFLLIDGQSQGRPDGWHGFKVNNNPLVQHAINRGIYQAEDPDNSLLPGHVLSAALPACLNLRSYWWLAIARKDRPYDPYEQFLITSLLRHIVARFDATTEPQFCRILLDSEQDILHADVIMCLRLTQHQEMPAQIKGDLFPVIQQRWKKLADHQYHHLFINLLGQPTWVRFRPGCADQGHQRHWYLELRTLDTADPPALGMVEDPRVALALGYLSDHYQRAPALADVAQYVQTSPFHFHRMFTRQAGISPKHFLLRNQLLHAKHQLLSTRAPIGDIARHCGFASHGHFTATFNRMVGLSPSDYRERN
ncbi:MAG: helix-turn-helix transcriptional regulator [Phycisphaeraceae bacterium]|nr:helix-turn-helix transcriptional regulator [Phycisphaeraceae bacterium]